MVLAIGNESNNIKKEPSGDIRHEKQLLKTQQGK